MRNSSTHDSAANWIPTCEEGSSTFALIKALHRGTKVVEVLEESRRLRGIGFGDDSMAKTLTASTAKRIIEVKCH